MTLFMMKSAIVCEIKWQLNVLAVRDQLQVNGISDVLAATFTPGLVSLSPVPRHPPSSFIPAVYV